MSERSDHREEYSEGQELPPTDPGPFDQRSSMRSTLYCMGCSRRALM